MKKVITFLLITSFILCAFFTVSADEIPNVIDAKNSGFEEISDIKETDWYKLIDSNGSTNSSPSLFTNITIKTDGGHTGSNYLSATLKQSWHAPSINFYPFVEAVGPDAYVLSFWYRSNKKLKLTKFLVRGLKDDAYEDGGEFQPDIVSKGSGNYYGYINGTSTDADANGWRCFISDPFEIVEEQFDGKKHNWWFCLDQLPATSDAPLVLDIDDFGVYSELDFEKPETLVEETKLVTNISYITEDVKTNALDVVIPEKATPAPDATPIPEAPENNSDMTLTIIIASAAFIVGAAITASIVIIAKKKKK